MAEPLGHTEHAPSCTHFLNSGQLWGALGMQTFTGSPTTNWPRSLERAHGGSSISPQSFTLSLHCPCSIILWWVDNRRERGCLRRRSDSWGEVSSPVAVLHDAILLGNDMLSRQRTKFQDLARSLHHAVFPVIGVTGVLWNRLSLRCPGLAVHSGSSMDNIEDIEDIVSGKDAPEVARVVPKRHVLPKKIRTKAENKTERAEGDSHLPGTQSIFLKTWGCSHNNSDGEYMAGQLAAYGYTITGKCFQLSACLSVKEVKASICLSVYLSALNQIKPPSWLSQDRTYKIAKTLQVVFVSSEQCNKFWCTAIHKYFWIDRRQCKKEK